MLKIKRLNVITVLKRDLITLKKGIKITQKIIFNISSHYTFLVFIIYVRIRREPEKQIKYIFIVSIIDKKKNGLNYRYKICSFLLV